MGRKIEIVGAVPEGVMEVRGEVTPRVYGYVRVSSTDEARQTLSPTAQRQVIQEYCRLNGLARPLIVEERGSAATIRKRPELVMLLEKARGGFVSDIVVQDLSRLFRDVREALNTFHDIEQECGVRFHSATRAHHQYAADTADGRFVRGLDVLLGERERAILSERIGRVLRETKQVRPEDAKLNPAMERRHREGKLLCGVAPIGYKWGPGKPGKRKLVRHPHYAEIIPLILKLREEGMGYRPIARHLNRVLHLRTHRGKPFHHSAVARIIQRETS